MKRIGIIKGSDLVNLLEDYYAFSGISVQIDEDGDSYEFWVKDESQVEESRKIFKEYLEDPDGDKYVATRGKAIEVMEEELEQLRNLEKNMHKPFEELQPKLPPLSKLVMIICGLMYIGQLSLGMDFQIFFMMFIPSNIEGSAFDIIFSMNFYKSLTPVFLHSSKLPFGLLHIVFNLYWFKLFSPLVEKDHKAYQYILIFIVIGVFSNLMQFIFFGPFFLGLSGVVDGLFGFCLAKYKFEKQSKYFLPDNVIFLLGFFMILPVFVPVFGNAAHGAHFGGFAMGLFLGSIGVIKKMFLSKT